MKFTRTFAAGCAAAVYLLASASVLVHADPPAGEPPLRERVTNDSPAGPDFVRLRVSSSSARKTPLLSRFASRGEALARTALAYRGAPYRFGGRSARTGFDCSGLVQTVCAKWGIYVPRAAHAQYSAGKRVPANCLQPGDLVFFKNTYKRGLSHVGIYIGNRKFLHAAGVRYGVMVSSLDDAYHRKHYVGARRMDVSKLPPVPSEEGEPQRVLLDDGGGDSTGTPPAEISTR